MLRFHLLVCVLALTLLPVPAQETATKSLAERKRERLKDGAAGFWIYDDVDAGFAKAKATGKPLLVSFRCVP